MTNKIPIALAVLALIWVPACGSDGSSDDDTSNSGTESTLSDEPNPLEQKTPENARKVVEAFNAAFISGDSEAGCALLTPEYQQQTIAESAEITDVPPTNCEEALDTGTALAKAFGYDPSAAIVGEATVTGDTATLLLQPGDETFEDTTYTLTWVDDRWLISAA